MGYNETINIIKEEARRLKENIENNQNFIIGKGDFYNFNGVYLKNMSAYLAHVITQRLEEPWLSLEELEEIYNTPIKKGKTKNKKPFYQIGDDKIYSSVWGHNVYLDDNGFANIYLNLGFIGNINKYYNPYFDIKIQISNHLVYSKLIYKDINLDNIKCEYEEDKDRIIINVEEL